MVSFSHSIRRFSPYPDSARSNETRVDQEDSPGIYEELAVVPTSDEEQEREREGRTKVSSSSTLPPTSSFRSHPSIVSTRLTDDPTV